MIWLDLAKDMSLFIVAVLVILIIVMSIHVTIEDKYETFKRRLAIQIEGRGQKNHHYAIKRIEALEAQLESVTRADMPNCQKCGDKFLFDKHGTICIACQRAKRA